MLSSRFLLKSDQQINWRFVMFTIRKSIFLPLALMSFVFQGATFCQDNKLLQVSEFFPLGKSTHAKLASVVKSFDAEAKLISNIRIMVSFHDHILAQFFLKVSNEEQNMKNLKKQVLNKLSLIENKKVPINEKVSVLINGNPVFENTKIKDLKELIRYAPIDIIVRDTPKTLTIKTLTGNSATFFYDRIKCTTIENIIRVACDIFNKPIPRKFSHSLVIVKPKTNVLDNTKTLSELGVQPNTDLVMAKNSKHKNTNSFNKKNPKSSKKTSSSKYVKITIKQLNGNYMTAFFEKKSTISEVKKAALLNRKSNDKTNIKSGSKLHFAIKLAGKIIYS